MREIVRGYITYFMEESFEDNEFNQITLAAEALTRTLAESAELRNVLSDLNVGKMLRKSIVKDLISKKFSADSAAILSFMAAAEPSAQLGSAINQMVTEIDSIRSLYSHHKASQNGADPLPLSSDTFASVYLTAFQKYSSYGQVHDLAAGYLEPIFEKTEDISQLKVMEDNLYAVNRLLEENRDLVKALGDPYGNAQAKLAIVSSLFASRVDQLTYRILRFIASIPRVRDVSGLVGFCVELITRERGRRLAEVRAVVPLSSEETARLRTLLERLVDRKVEMRFVTDQTIMAGFVVLIGDYVLDASLLTKFNKLSESLALSA